MKFLTLISFLFCAALSSADQAAKAEAFPALFTRAVHSAMRNTVGTALVLDIASNQILAAEKPEIAGQVLATPGSTLKPFFLLTALQAGVIPESERVYCRRSLRIGGRAMNCVHPAIAHALDAREALAHSCNTYFADVAARLYAQRGGESLAEVMRSRGIDQAPALIAGTTPGSVRGPRSVVQAQLFVLGVEGVIVSPLALGEAYRTLTLEIARSDATAAAHFVARAREDCVRYGMADSATVGGVRVAGKTWTASAAEGGTTHGWFVGYASADKPRMLVVVFLPQGHGTDAARSAGAIFAMWAGHFA